MKVLVSEYLVGGASLGQAVSDSMRREGLAMLRAVTSDIARMADWSVVTTLEADLSKTLDAEVIPIRTSSQEEDVFQKLLTQVDAVLVIAPETDGVLAKRCQTVRSAGVASWNCHPDAIELCGDKLNLSIHLQSRQIPTVSTRRVTIDVCPDFANGPCVLKPRDGAGSQLIFVVSDENEWKDAVRQIYDNQAADKCVIQPFVCGRALSIGVNLSIDGRYREILAVAEQRLSCDRLLRYLGGCIPAKISATASKRIVDTVSQMCDTIPGLAGYLGIDFILTDQDDPIIVEINPRLTTSYVGYRQFYSACLAERWLLPNPSPLYQSQNSDVVEFVAGEF